MLRSSVFQLLVFMAIQHHTILKKQHLHFRLFYL